MPMTGRWTDSSISTSSRPKTYSAHRVRARLGAQAPPHVERADDVRRVAEERRERQRKREHPDRQFDERLAAAAASGHGSSLRATC